MKHILIFIAIAFIPLLLNAQNNSKQRKFDSTYVSNGINKIAKQVYKNGWIKFDPNSNIKAADFFKNHKAKLGLKEDDEMILIKVISDDLGFSHYKYYQKHKGIKVEFSETTLHEKNGILLKTSGNVIPQLTLNIKPMLSENEAFEHAVEFLNTKFGKVLKVFLTKSELVILPFNEKLHINRDYLSYKFYVHNENGMYSTVLYTDANNGTILLEDMQIVNTDAIGNADTKYSGNKIITTDFTGSTYRLRDYSRGSGILTFDLTNGSVIDFTHSPNTWTPADPGYDIHWAMEKTYDYFYNTYGRKSFDDSFHVINSWANTNLMELDPLFKNNNNAFWDPYEKVFVFGTGDTTEYNSWASVDIVAHEFTHAITDYSADLFNVYESGALNESFSDIFGTIVEWASKENANWLLADEISNSIGFPIRNLENPNDLFHNLLDPDTYHGTYWYYGNEDLGGVHTNCGVQNFWFYLLTNGGSSTNDFQYIYNVTGIGMEDAAAIAYRNLTVYLKSNSDYEDARIGSIEAAADISGSECSNEVFQVINAWDAVGVTGSDNIEVCDEIISDGTNHLALNNIYVGCAPGTTSINTGSTVVFKAGNSIQLNPGFQAQYGCTFIASVFDCGGGGLKSAYHPNKGNYNETNNKNNLEEKPIDEYAALDINIYPNPTTGLINVQINNFKNNAISIAVYDFQGTVVYNLVAKQSFININLSGKAPGIYYLRIFDGNKTITRKIIKN